MIKSGVVIKSTGSWFTVLDENNTIVNCKIKGTFKLKGLDTTNPLAVGDRVDFELPDMQDSGLIVKIHERKNYIIRKSTKLSKQAHMIASNLDSAILVASLVSPKTSMGFMDRFLVTATAYDIPGTIIFNKADLYNEDVSNYYEELVSIYKPLGYRCILASSNDGRGIEEIQTLLSSGVHLISGVSGSGKSTLVNTIEPGLQLKTGAISKQHQKGTHTTTFAEMHRLSSGAFVIDTPGIRDFGIIEMEPWEISHYFPEMISRLNGCQYNNCLHVQEPGCAIKDALEEGKIHPWRYYSYISILNNEDTYK